MRRHQLHALACALVLAGLLGAPAAAAAGPAAAAAGPRRSLQQQSNSGGTYDPIAVECKASEELCYKTSCNGLIKFSCDDKGNSKCICESAGLASCFPGAATVATPAGPKRLADLQLGETVLALDPATGALAFSTVHMWSSRRPGQTAQVLTVHTDAGLNLTVTPGHYLFAWRGEGAVAAAEAALARPQSWPYVLPGQLAPGDVVPVVAAAWEGSRHVELARVTAVELGHGHGVFMPHTLTGAIVVDGVVASELTSVVPPALAGPMLQRGLAASLRLAARLLPPTTLEATVRFVSGWVHGVADAAVSAQTLLGVS